ncbi:MAG: flagellar biosynthesis protein FlgD [Bdellovibrionales bacterium]|nr:flagellar biosynthesis protein FlgD [Bdellovibrionales bacterium]
MISISQSTKTWSDATQNSSLKPDSASKVSPDEYRKAFGDKDVGEVLNKLADPNWVDPAKMRKVGNNQLDRDAFLKLLLTQLKYQDPTNPMQNHEMAAQLAQFSSLESLSNIDRGVGELTKSAQPKNDFAALNLIGKAVSGDSSRISRSSEEDVHEVVYNLMGDAQQLKVKILDSNNQPVRELVYDNLKKGRNTLNWNGKDEDGQPARLGEYRASFEALDAKGKKLGLETQFEGRISGVNFTPEGPMLLVGNQSIRMSDVRKIVDPDQLKQLNLELKNSESGVQADRHKEQAPHSRVSSSSSSSQQLAQAPQGNLESVGMSREMLNKMKNQGVEAGL